MLIVLSRIELLKAATTDLLITFQIFFIFILFNEQMFFQKGEHQRTFQCIKPTFFIIEYIGARPIHSFSIQKIGTVAQK